MTEDRAGEAALSQSEFQQLRRVINDRAGLAFDDDARYLLERRLSERLIELELESFEPYIELLASSSDEQEAAFTLLTTKETYFFRQEYQLKAFTDEILPRLAEASSGSRRLTVWSAGCSTGEEAYTLAMLLSESEHVRRFRVRVVGSDLCQRNIDIAERGIYRRTSFRTTSEERISQYFRERRDGSLQVNDEIRRMCHFSRVNLMSPLAVRSVGRVDIIFCRNVLIYFDEQSRQRVTAQFFQRLLPGGYLLLGHSESLLNTETQFVPIHLEGDLVYRRPPMTTNSGRPL